MFDQFFDPQHGQQLREVLRFGLILLAVFSWLSALVCLLCIPSNSIPGSLPRSSGLRSWFKPDSFRDWMLLNPLNVILYSDLLTPKGRVLRKCLFISVAVFVVCVLLGVAFSRVD